MIEASNAFAKAVIGNRMAHPPLDGKVWQEQ
jgi:hypothetical protein